MQMMEARSRQHGGLAFGRKLGPACEHCRKHGGAQQAFGWVISGDLTGPYGLLVGRVQQLEARPALELALRVFAGRRVDVALAGLAQEARFDHQVALRR